MILAATGEFLSSMRCELATKCRAPFHSCFFVCFKLEHGERSAD
jgi:hypothetical protein